MTKTKNTKRALLASVLSLLLCVSMLVGSTFAWFTHSVTSKENQIVAGNLHIGLEASTDLESWDDVNAENNKTGLFREGKYWEPGHVEYAAIRVKNDGDMAVKYKISLKELGKTMGYTENDDEIDLAKHLQFAVLKMSEWTDADADNDASSYDPAKYIWKIIKATKEGYITQDEGREWLLEVIENNKDSHKLISDSPYIEGVLKGKAEGTIAGTDVDETEWGTETDDGVVSEPYLLVVYMPKEVQNEANYGMGKTQPTIDLGVNVEAKQFTYEEDAFSNQYDASATYDGKVAKPDGNESGGTTGTSDTTGRISFNINVRPWIHAIPGFEYEDDLDMGGW